MQLQSVFRFLTKLAALALFCSISSHSISQELYPANSGGSCAGSCVGCIDFANSASCPAACFGKGAATQQQPQTASPQN